MVSFKCVSCGKIIAEQSADSIIVCEHCGAKQTMLELEENALLEQAFTSLEKKEWHSADGFLSLILFKNQENSQAYLGKLMAKYEISKKEELKQCDKLIDSDINYQKAMCYGDESLKKFLEECTTEIIKRTKVNQLDDTYTRAVEAMKHAESCTSRGGIKELEEAILSYQKAIQLFDMNLDYKDSFSLKKQCEIQKDIVEKDKIYTLANNYMKVENRTSIEAAIHNFKRISGWRDVDEKLIICQNKLEVIEENEIIRQAEHLQRKEKECLEKEQKIKRRKKTILYAAIILLFMLVFVFVDIYVFVPNRKYKNALSSIKEKKYVKAYDTLIALEGYKDSAQVAETIYNDYIGEMVSEAEVGDTIFFGHLEQDDDIENGKEKIKWLVLDKDTDKILVISQYALAQESYDDRATAIAMGEMISWEECTLREWLNADFLNEAFISTEKEMICTTKVAGDDNSGYVSNAGNDTFDQIFLLGIDEVEKYFSTNSERICCMTKNLFMNHHFGTIGFSFNAEDMDNPEGPQIEIPWCLRFMGKKQDDGTPIVMAVDESGELVGYEVTLPFYRYTIRPAMWIEIPK